MANPITWPQDHLRRATEAVAERLKQGPPVDVLMLARAACEAAVRNDVDLAVLAERTKKG